MVIPDYVKASLLLVLGVKDLFFSKSGSFFSFSKLIFQSLLKSVLAFQGSLYENGLLFFFNSVNPRSKQ